MEHLRFTVQTKLGLEGFSRVVFVVDERMLPLCRRRPELIEDTQFQLKGFFKDKLVSLTNSWFSIARSGQPNGKIKMQKTSSFTVRRAGAAR